jgi:hypothetical protein
LITGGQSEKDRHYIANRGQSEDRHYIDNRGQLEKDRHYIDNRGTMKGQTVINVVSVLL